MDTLTAEAEGIDWRRGIQEGSRPIEADMGTDRVGSESISKWRTGTA